MKIYTKQEIEAVAANNNFIKGNIEKVIRLIDILAYINETSSSAGRFALKGGTAINLCVLNIPRLSVDIDLDFAQNLSKEETEEFRLTFKEIFTEFAEDYGYRVSEKSRGHFALDSFLLNYDATSGNRDNIKVEINYQDRAHILPCCMKSTCTLGTHRADTLMLDSLELYASKTKALLSRRTPRDLYDVYQMVTRGIVTDINLFRKCLVFYNLVAGEMDVDSITPDVLNRIRYDEIRRYLKPVIAKNDDFSYEHAVQVVKDFLDGILSLTDLEKQFACEFRNRNYRPELLFDDEEIIARIKNHPMALWRTRENG